MHLDRSQVEKRLEWLNLALFPSFATAQMRHLGHSCYLANTMQLLRCV